MFYVYASKSISGSKSFLLEILEGEVYPPRNAWNMCIGSLCQEEEICSSLSL